MREKELLGKIFAGIACLAILAGCVKPHIVSEAVKGAPAAGEVSLVWTEAVRAYREGDYSTARGLFQALAESGGNETDCRRGCFGAAVVRLLTAPTPEEYAGGVWEWKICVEQTPSEDGMRESMDMLTPLLERFSPIKVLAPPAVQSVSPPRPSHAISAASAWKSLLQEKDKEVEHIKSKLDAKDKEIRRLKQQLNSIEAIHLKYQEKKKGVSSP